MRNPKWRDGDEADYRFTLANERTFLAWIRTALALLAGGVLLHEFVHELDPRIVVVIVAIVLAVVSAVVSVLTYVRWRANEVAMRHGRPLPVTALIPALAVVVLVISAVVAVLFVVQ